MKESQMLNAWLWKYHQRDLQWRRIRLGPLPTKELARMYMVMLRWADAIVIHDNTVTIIEAGLRAQPGKISQLKLYKELFPNTPEFEAYRNYNIEMLILTDILDLQVAELCSKEGIKYEVFSIDDVNAVRKQQMLPVLL